MYKFVIAVFVLCILALPGQQLAAADAMTPEQLVQRVLSAHGGYQRWSGLDTLAMQREHYFIHRDSRFRFAIEGSLKSQRIHQVWTEPAGEVFWDGERAWSTDWPLANRFLPRFVQSIGFYLATLPWHLAGPDANLVALEKVAGMLPGDTTPYWVLKVEFEADMVKKPRDYQGPRDYFEVYVDPGCFLIRGVMQHRTYAGQFDAAGAPAGVREFAEIFIPDEHVAVAGLVFPRSYKIFSPAGEQTAEGRFSGYETNRPLDDSVFVPQAGPGVVFDHSSSYRRSPGAPDSVIPEERE